MPNSLAHPVSVTHQGLSILFVAELDAAGSSVIYYNVLDPSRGNADNDLDWTGYSQLAFPTQVATLGVSIGRVTRAVSAAGLFQVVSDQDYIYLFRSEGNSIYVNRYRLVPVKSGNIQGVSAYNLQPAWEVRYQRSGKADLPASDKDTPNAKSIEGQPYLEPIYELPLGFEGVDLVAASFSVTLEATTTEGDYRWQFFVPNLKSGQIASYSFRQSSEGWFLIAPEQIDAQSRMLKPDAYISLKFRNEPLALAGPLCAANYYRQEPILADSNTVLQMKRAVRTFLATPVQTVAGDSRLATIDFGVSVDGLLSGLQPDDPGRIVEWEAGMVQPAGSMLAFDGASAVKINDGDSSGPLILPQTFTIEGWISPSASTLKQQFVVGGDLQSPVESQAPSLWIEHGTRVGASFGDGTRLVRNITRENVLTVDAWNHVAVTHDSAGLKIFINGFEVPLADAQVENVTPATTPVSAIGAMAQWVSGQVRGVQVTASAHTEKEYEGLLDELRIWDIALTQADIAAYLYKEIPAAEAEQLEHLFGYWRFDEGEGSITNDFSRYKRNGMLSGPRWESTTSPVLPEDDARTYFDKNGLTTVVGLLVPTEDHPNFGRLAAQSRVALLEGADGLLHLYFKGAPRSPGEEGTFFGAQFDTNIARAYYGVPWVAGAANPSIVENGTFAFVARGSGSIFNHASVKVTAANHPLLCDVTLNDGRGEEEVWHGVPRRLDGLLSALNGNATPQVTDRRLVDGSKRFYDYGGRVNMGAVLIGDADTAHSLWFLSSHVGPFALKRVQFEKVSNEFALKIVLASDAAHPSEELQRTLKNFPADAASFALTVAGANPNYDYSAPAGSGEPRVFAIPAKPSPLAMFVPDAAISGMTTTVSSASNGDPLFCNLEIVLNPGASPIAASWSNVHRSSSQLIPELYLGSDPAQKKVLGFVRIMDPGSTRAVNGSSKDEADVMPFLSGLVLVNDGVTGSITDFDCPASALQGATSTNKSVDLRNGSILFAVATSSLPVNGYPQIVNLGNQGMVAATLLKPGQDGGWLDEPPRYAIRIHPDGFLSADVSQPPIDVLAVDKNLTIEAWARMVDTPPDMDISYPRILQFVHPEQNRADRYMLGMGMTSTLQFLRGTAVTTKDENLPEKSVDLRLFPGSDYTLQFYIRPDFSTPVAQNVLFTRTTSKASVEKLLVNVDRSLVYRIEPAGGQPVESSGPGSILQDKVWQLVSVTRNGEKLTIYVDKAAGNTIVNPPAIDAPWSSILVGGNDVASPLQFRMNQFSVWRRALSAEEVAANLWHSLATDASGLQLLWGMDNGSGTNLSLPNSATATQGHYDSMATGTTTFWNYPGVFYRAYFGCRDLAVQTRDAVAAPGEWHHYAGLYECKYGVEFTGTDYADCGNDGSLNVRNGVTVESWIWPSAASSIDRRAIVSKFGQTNSERSYELGLTGGNKPYLQIRIDGQRTQSGEDAPERLRLKTFITPGAVLKDKASYIVGTANIVTTPDFESSQSVYSLIGQVYVNGQPQIPGPEQIRPTTEAGEQTYQLQVLGGTGSGRYKKGTVVNITANDPSAFVRWRGQTSLKDPNTTTKVVNDPGSLATNVTVPGQDVVITAIGLGDQISITQSNTAVNLGRALSGSGNQGTAYFAGGISNVRLWSRALSASSIAQAYALKAPPSGTNGLVSAWTFREQQGNVAYDTNGTNNAMLSSSRLWTVFHDAAQLEIYVDGRVVPLEASLPGRYGPWGPAQFRVGGYQDEHGVYRDPFLGTLDELRVWKQQRTLEQINDNLYRYLTGGEAGLVGYWRFDAGSGRIIGDETINGNNLVFQAATPDDLPEWTGSDAPISNEAPIVQNAVNSFRTPFVIDIAEGPSVFEYPDTETDADGLVFSVMKRGYAYVQDGMMRHFVGYKVGDLRRVYIGQIQIKPSLIGYVEGAPPLPSENLTRPYYLDPIAMYFTYEGISSVTLTEKEGTEAHFSTLRKDQQGVASKLKAGLSGDEKVFNGVQVPLGPVIMYQEVKYEWEAVIANELEWSQASSSGAGVSASTEREYEIRVKSGGAWEEPDNVLLATGERRWVPSNTGVAVVKSATADMYGLYLPLLGSLVGLSIVPNKDIPVDVNLLYFPIDTSYVRNGSLDGRVGLQDDPSCLGNPSYFRPTEAYSLQRNIELQTAQLDAWYQQFNPSDRAKNQNSDLTDAVANSPFYDWSNKIPKKDMINKYVWAAGGGLYREQESYSSHRQETYGGDFDFSWKLGPAADLKFDLGPVGLHFELEVMGGTGWTVTVDKDKDQESALDLDVDIDPEAFLGRFLSDVQQPFFSEDPVPGKVDNYRFATYYLAPKAENTSDFLSKVVDQEWLELSSEPRAAALREIRDTGEGKSSWRVMHRVTFVSRVPPPFQAVPVESQAPPLADPPRLDENDLLIRLTALRLGEETTPTPAQIGAAVRGVYVEDLGKLLPWWLEFLKQATAPNSDQQKQLQQIITDSLTYMSEYYAVRGSKTAAASLSRQRLLAT